jgi:hypothetical protein
MGEARIGEVQSEDIVPINAAADGICGVALGEAFRTLEDGGQGKARWRLCGVPAPREERGDLRVVVDGAETVGSRQVDIPPRKRGAGTPLSVFRDRIGGLGMS